MGKPVPLDDLPGSRAVPADDMPVNQGIRNPVMVNRKASTERAKWDQYGKARTHEARMANDPYYKTAQESSFAENALAGMGGVFKGLGYTGPRQILGIDKPGEYEEYSASMSGLGSTGGGKLGTFAGYALPAAATAPLTGARAGGAALVSGIESFLDPAPSNQERAVKTLLGATTGAAGQKFANVLGTKANNIRANRQLRSYPGSETVHEKTLTRTLDLGYKLPPSAAGKNSTLEAVSGQIKTQQAASDLNQSVTDNLIRQEFGDASRFGFKVTPTTPLTSETMLGIRKAAGGAYERVKQVGKIQLIKGRTKAGNPIVQSFDAADAVDNIKQLRHDGYSQLSTARSTGDPALLKQAKKTLDDAAKLEQKLDTALSDAGLQKLLDDLKASRTLIAKSYDVQDAIRDSVGKVDARDLGSLYEAGEKGYGPKLTGRLADVGKAGSAFRESMGLRGFDTPRYSALDFAVSGMNMANAPSGAGFLAGGIPLLRGAARDRLLSQPAQQSLRPDFAPPGSFVKALPKLLDYTPNVPLLGPVPYGRTVLPGLATGALLTYLPK